MNRLKTFFAYNSNDREEIRLEKFAIFLVAGATAIAGLIWSGMYYWVFGWGLTTFLPAGFTVLVGCSLIVSHVSKNHRFAIYTQIICVIYITFFIQWSIGTLIDSGFVLVWASIGPLTALMFLSVRHSTIWLLLYIFNIAITVIFNDYFVAHGQVVLEEIQLFFFLMNLSVCSVIIFIFASYYVNSSIRERAKAHKLLEANLQQEMLLRQSDKLATLGKLSAGVSHELNNPAAAAERGVEQLKKSVMKMEQAGQGLARLTLSPSQVQTVGSNIKRVHEQALQPDELDPVTRGDQEDKMQTWLEERGLADAWELGPMLVDAGYDCSDLTALKEQIPGEAFLIISSLLGNTYNVHNLLAEIGHGTGRIIEIVKAMKSYSYLDQAPIQSVDIHEGLDDTLVMLRSTLKKGIEVRRNYAQDLPRIEAYGSELNQVWTNIIDNAVSAMKGQGEIALKTYWDDNWVTVEIKDSGPGIPEKIQTRIFDPFFTTKAPGDGTGLGLNISHNIVVQKHKGKIAVRSKPGETCFEVKLPIQMSHQ